MLLFVKILKTTLWKAAHYWKFDKTHFGVNFEDSYFSDKSVQGIEEDHCLKSFISFANSSDFRFLQSSPYQNVKEQISYSNTSHFCEKRVVTLNFLSLWETVTVTVPHMRCVTTNACNFTKSNTPPWEFFTFFKLYKWYQIVQSISYHHLSYS